MKTKTILMLVAVFMAATSYCQQSRFKITHSHNSNAEWAKSILFPDDSTMWINANHGPISGGYGLMILRVNNYGVVTAKKIYEKPKYSYIGSWAGSMINLDTAYYVGGLYQWQDSINISKGYSLPYIAKLNLNGDTLWIKHYETDTAYHQGTSFCKTNNGNMLLAGSKSTSTPGLFNFFLMRVDTAGNLLWQKTYGLLNVNERASTVNEQPNGKILLSGVKVNASLTAANPWVLILDDTGKIEWQYTYTRPALIGGGGYTKPAKTGGFFLQGMVDTLINPGENPSCPYIARMENNGSFRWLKIFNSKWFTQIWDFYELDNGDMVFCGDKIDSAANTEYGYIAKIDSFGNIKWWRNYYEKPSGFHYLTCIRPTSDGGYVAVGSAVGINTNSQDAWIIKTDSMGCVVANCFVDVEDVEGMQKGTKVYPNPAKDHVVFSYNLQNASENLKLTITDVSGKLVVETPLTNSKGIFHWYTNSVQNGMYFYKISDTKTHHGSGKVVILK